MRFLVAFLLLAILVAGNANAQYAPLKQKARDFGGKMTERHNGAAEGSPTPGQPSQPASPAVVQPPAVPIKPSTQQQAATKLKADIAEARSKGEVSAELKKQFSQDLSAAAQGNSRPSQAALTKFGESFLTSVAAKKIAPADEAKLVKNVVVSLNSAGLSVSRLQEINDEVQAVLTKSGVPAAETSLIAQHLGAIVAEIQSNARK